MDNRTVQGRQEEINPPIENAPVTENAEEMVLATPPTEENPKTEEAAPPLVTPQEIRPSALTEEKKNKSAQTRKALNEEAVAFGTEIYNPEQGSDLIEDINANLQ